MKLEILETRTLLAGEKEVETEKLMELEKLKIKIHELYIPSISGIGSENYIYGSSGGLLLRSGEAHTAQEKPYFSGSYGSCSNKISWAHEEDFVCENHIYSSEDLLSTSNEDESVVSFYASILPVLSTLAAISYTKAIDDAIVEKGGLSTLSNQDKILLFVSEIVSVTGIDISHDCHAPSHNFYYTLAAVICAKIVGDLLAHYTVLQPRIVSQPYKSENT